MRSPQKSDAAILSLAFITFAIIFGLIGFYQGIEVGEADRAEIAAKTHHENAAEQIKNACVGADLAAFRVCVEEAIQTSGEYQRAERDLAAQKNMAIYAKWLLALSVFTSAVTAFGVWFVKITLDETRRAVASADAAVGVTREIGQAQVRAYVSFEAKSVTVRKPDLDPSAALSHDAPNLVIEINGTLVNSGQSPAYRVNAFFDVQEVSPGEVRKLHGTEGLQDNGIAAVSIAAGGDTNQQFRRIWKTDIDRVMRGEVLIWFAVFVEYDDVFLGRRYTPHISGHIDIKSMSGKGARIIIDTVQADHHNDPD